MEWVNVYFHKSTGTLIDGEGVCVIFDQSGRKPAKFTDASEAEDYLVEHDIRASIVA